jgi:thymidylate synthase ThyX
MPEFKDAGHRDHAKHYGETPTTGVDRGPYGLKVTLDQWGPYSPSVMEAYLQSNWGDDPMPRDLPYQEGAQLTASCFAGRTLQQILEGISFWFTIDGVTRANTHQIVRTRAAAFMQHGGRDNDWRHRRFSMPESVDRACIAHSEGVDNSADPTGSELLYALGLKHSITDWKPIDRLIGSDDTYKNMELREVLEDYLDRGKRIYSALVDAGIPWQDARRYLFIGLQTYIHGIYNYRSLKDTLSNRLEFVMDWEYCCVGQLMVRELRMKCPKVVWEPIMSVSDRTMRAAFAGLESWPPDGKYPIPNSVCKTCGLTFETGDHPYTNNVGKVEGFVTHYFDSVDPTPRTHRPEQNPFWVLTENALNGGLVEWIPTNGVYPHDNPKAPKPRP